MLRLIRFLCLCYLHLALFSGQTYGAIVLGESGNNPAEIDYNLRIGTLQFNLAAGTRFFWNSNLNLSSSDEEAAFAIVPNMSIQAYWPISPYLVFSNAITIGYTHYLEGGENRRDGLTIEGLNQDARSRYDVDFSLSNDAIITLSNTFSANIVSASIQTNDGQNNAQRQNQPFRQFISVSSLQYAQRLTPYTRTSLGYSFSDTFTRNVSTKTTINNTIDNQAHSFFAELGTQLDDSLILSLQGNVSSTTYAAEFRNDFRQYQLGPRLNYISRAGLNTSFYLAVNQLNFDDTNSPTTQENESTNLIFESSVNFSTGNYLTHTFELDYLQEPSPASTSNPETPGETIPANFQERTSFNYQINYLLNERLNINLSYRLSRIKESDGGNQYSSEMISAGVPFQLNARTTISTRYIYFRVFGSEFAEFNYNRHLVAVTFRLNF